MAQVTDDPRAPDGTVDAPVPVPAPPATRLAATPRALDNGSWLQQRISTAAAALMGAAWWWIYILAVSVEPTSHHEEPAITVVLSYAMLAGLLVMAAGLIARRRWGLVASLGTAGLLSALVIACPTTGHHTIGAWWFLQVACAGALVGGSVFALRRA